CPVSPRSVSFLKPVMHLFTSIFKEVEDDTDLTRTITTTVMGYLNEKYKDPDMDDLLDMALLVDPRFKLQYTEEEREYIKERAVVEMLKGERAVMVRDEESREEAIGDASAAGPPAKETERSLASFFFKQAHHVQHRRLE
ncbi:hypothetical protein GOODEAATRI_032129, partial [Goodea atripinnis]